MTNKLSVFLLIITKFVFTQTSLPCNNNIFCDPANAIPNEMKAEMEKLKKENAELRNIIKK